MFPTGTVFSCTHQTKGVGRGSNVWISPKGCLMFTFKATIPREKGGLMPFFQYLVALAIVKSVEKIHSV